MTTITQQAAHIEEEIRANRLLDLPVPWHEEIIYPHYGGFSIYNIAHSVLALLGEATNGDAEITPLDPAVWGGAAPQAERVIFFLLDGMGYRLLNEMSAEDAEVADAISELTDGRGAVPLTSIAPSTTAVALPTLWTGAPPAAHGMLGSMMFLREAATMTDMLRYEPAIGDAIAGFFDQLGMKADDFVTLPSIAQRLNAPTHVILDRKLLHTGLSRVLHRGIAHPHMHIGGDHLWAILGEVLTQTAGQRGYINIYWPDVDMLSHLYGAQSHHVKSEIKTKLLGLRDLLRWEAVHDGQTLFIFTADHGHHDAPEILTDIGHNASRMPFGGDVRFAQYYLRDSQRQRLIDTLTRDHLDQLAWIEPEAAVHAGLFGPGVRHPELMHRLGDLILVPRLGIRLADALRRGKPISVHGGLSDWEMLVPFLWRTF